MPAGRAPARFKPFFSAQAFRVQPSGCAREKGKLKLEL
jgi:hypothetical protein